MPGPRLLPVVAHDLVAPEAFFLYAQALIRAMLHAHVAGADRPLKLSRLFQIAHTISYRSSASPTGAYCRVMQRKSSSIWSMI
jgi:hypothetical protein